MKALEAEVSAPPVKRRWLELVFGFVCIFGGLSLPLPGLPMLYTATHQALGNVILPGTLDSGVDLAFGTPDVSLGQDAWSLTLFVRPPAPRQPINMPVDLRTLLYLPEACFAALALATPLRSKRQNLTLLRQGLVILHPLLLVLITLPIVSFLGGTGPVQAFELGRWVHTLLQIAYRALVASPGMAYAIPLFLWWALLVRLRSRTG